MLQSMRDQPGTQREYETIYIVRPEATTDQLQELNTRVKGVIEGSSGKLLKVENWGKRKLAYEIKKNTKGIYLYWRYLAPSALVAELERNLRMIDLVIRFLSVRVDADVDPNARPSDVTAESFDAAAESRPDEEDYYMGRAGDDAGDDDDDGDESGSGDDGDAGDDDQSDDANDSDAASGDGGSDEDGEASDGEGEK